MIGGHGTTTSWFSGLQPPRATVPLATMTPHARGPTAPRCCVLAEVLAVGVPTLAPTDSTVCTAAYTVVPGDASASRISNTAEAVASSPRWALP